MPSLRVKFLKAERSVFHHAGAVIMSRPEVPNFSGSVAENAVGLNQYEAFVAAGEVFARRDAVERGERVNSLRVGPLRHIGQSGQIRRRDTSVNSALP